MCSEATIGNAQGLLLALNQEMIPGRIKGSYGVLVIEPRLPSFRVSALLMY